VQRNALHTKFGLIGLMARAAGRAYTQFVTTYLSLVKYSVRYV